MIIYSAANETVERHWGETLSTLPDTIRAKTIADLDQLINASDNGILLLRIPQDGLLNTRDLKNLRGKFPKARIIIFSDRPENTEGQAVLKVGAYGYCNSYMANDLLLLVIKTVKGGEVWVGWELMQQLIKGIRHTEDEIEPSIDLDLLTRRELEIAQLVGSGENNKKIASKLNISERTVKNHLHTIFQKTGVKDRLNLALQIKARPLVQSH